MEFSIKSETYLRYLERHACMCCLKMYNSYFFGVLVLTILNLKTQSNFDLPAL